MGAAIIVSSPLCLHLPLKALNLSVYHPGPPQSLAQRSNRELFYVHPQRRRLVASFTANIVYVFRALHRQELNLTESDSIRLRWSILKTFLLHIFSFHPLYRPMHYVSGGQANRFMLHYCPLVVLSAPPFYYLLSNARFRDFPPNCAFLTH